FDPITQPEIWSAESFEKIYSIMKPGGVLTTYCSKSHIRKTMMSVGFKVTKIPGPWGKREMVRAER
ncbi:MAG TPA: MnmC family methyltransferase, partial [Flavitalea sp.]|nr:MnmC family methyltransferase [Flavitalea sp.]